jgi:hypothetical protein
MGPLQAMTFMRRTIRRFSAALLLLAAVIAAVGCSEEVIEPVVVAVPAPKSNAEIPVSGQATSASITASQPAPDKSDKPLTTAVSYSAPFPNRSDPFEAPKQARSSVRVGEGDENDSVELNGFVMVDTPRAILSIDGQIVLLPEGGEKYGVEVISIDAPRVVLQRGSSRWTATLD